MQETVVDKKQIKAIARIPFLAEFPYPEFKFQYHLMQTVSKSTFEAIAEPMDVILFSYSDDSSTMVNILEREIWHLYEIRDNVKFVNEISSKITQAMVSDDILVKRDAALDAEEWFKNIKGKKFVIGTGTFSDILTSFVGRNNVDGIVQMSHITNRLYERKGIIFLTKEQKKVLVKYFQFQLIYYKMLIGIILAAKISL